jgi:D-alanine-D-alanine ligase
MHPDFVPPDSSDGYSVRQINEWKTEYDVVSTLRAAGHEVRPLGVQEEIKPVREAIEGFKPHVVFNLLEQFHHEPVYDQHIPSLLELMQVPYTGCNPRGLILARGKDLSKTLVHHRRIAVPAFAVFPMRRKIKRPARLALPLIVKSLSEDGSAASRRHPSSIPTRSSRSASPSFTSGSDTPPSPSNTSRDASFMSACSATIGCGSAGVGIEIRQHGRPGRAADRHRKGQARSRLSGDASELWTAGQGPRAGTERPHSANGKTHLPNAGLDGYARIDFRLSADGTPYFIEANPNPEIAKSQEFALRRRTMDSITRRAASYTCPRNKPGKGRRIRRLKDARKPRANSR